MARAIRDAGVGQTGKSLSTVCNTFTLASSGIILRIIGQIAGGVETPHATDMPRFWHHLEGHPAFAQFRHRPRKVVPTCPDGRRRNRSCSLPGELMAPTAARLRSGQPGGSGGYIPLI